ncbi:zf-HC2 domain-containing protein [Pseudonocardia nematodicida]|uniref:Zf-HC2 domain-containing protein n=1 Tax=Pseudonocardia nematodicida TaxID=1206997 RepID=A0ABV1KEL3_9PSEU
MRESLGDFAIGRLDAEEAATVQAHLDGCADCRAELAEVSSVLGPLSTVDAARLGDAPVPSPDLGDRIVAAARAEGRAAERGRSTPRRLTLAAAAAVALLVGGAGGYAAGAYDGIPREPVAVQAMEPGVEVSAVAIPHTWGVEIVLDGDGFASGATYRMVVESKDGREVGAGEFIGTGESKMVCNMNSSVLRGDAEGFKVVDTSGATVLRGDLTAT